MSFSCFERVSFNTADCILSLKTECIFTSVIYSAVLHSTFFEEEIQQQLKELQMIIILTKSLLTLTLQNHDNTKSLHIIQHSAHEEIK